MISLIAHAISVTILFLSGVALTWTCALVGFWNLSPGGCHGSNEKRARVRVGQIATAITEFTVDQDRCPRTQEDLAANSRYAEPFVDPWGTSLFFSCSSRAIVVISAGPDRLFNTADDFVSVRTLDAEPVTNPDPDERAATRRTESVGTSSSGNTPRSPAAASKARLPRRAASRR